jgi:V8-like Glu-specific endopeptidase
VSGRWPLRLGNSTELLPGDEIFALGFPQGIPMIWNSAGQIRRHDGPLKVFAHLDVSEGNSGSPIFASKTLEVLGVLIEGEEDLHRNRKKSCNQSVMCDQQGCHGEIFLSADVLKPFVN